MIKINQNFQHLGTHLSLLDAMVTLCPSFQPELLLDINKSQSPTLQSRGKIQMLLLISALICLIKMSQIFAMPFTFNILFSQLHCQVGFIISGDFNIYGNKGSESSSNIPHIKDKAKILSPFFPFLLKKKCLMSQVLIACP